MIYGAESALGLALARRYARHMGPEDALVLIAPCSKAFEEAVAEVDTLARCRLLPMALDGSAAVWRAKLCDGLMQAGLLPCCLVVPVAAKGDVLDDVVALVKQLHPPQVALVGEGCAVRRVAAELRRDVTTEAVDIHAQSAEACAKSSAAELPALLSSVSRGDARGDLADVVAMMSSPLGRRLWRRNLVARR